MTLTPREAAINALGWVALVLAACQDPAPEPAATQASSGRAAPTVSAAKSSPPSATAESGPPCPSPFGADGLTFFDNNPVPSQRDYPESYLYELKAVAGACPVTHIDITVTGPGLVGGVRARLETRSATKIDLMAEPAAAGDAATWRPDVKRGELLGSVVLRNGRAVGLRLPKLSGPNRGLPVFHPETDLALDQ